MNLSIREMTEEEAIQSLKWEYEPPYDFYNVAYDEESLSERMDGSYKVVYDGETFIGFFCTGESARVPAGNKTGVYEQDFVDMGLGLHPEWTGQGKGFQFGMKVLTYIKETEPGYPVRLSVATFNKRAIRLYENMGFVKKDTFYTSTHPFITMVAH